MHVCVFIEEFIKIARATRIFIGYSAKVVSSTTTTHEDAFVPALRKNTLNCKNYDYYNTVQQAFENYRPVFIYLTLMKISP